MTDMNKILKFPGVQRKAKEVIEVDFNCSLSRALLCVQYCALVINEHEIARGILQEIQQAPSLDRLIFFPGKYRKIMDTMNAKETYLAILNGPVFDDD